jgi:hypothetical protein
MSPAALALDGRGLHAARSPLAFNRARARARERLRSAAAAVECIKTMP